MRRESTKNVWKEITTLGQEISLFPPRNPSSASLARVPNAENICFLNVRDTGPLCLRKVKHERWQTNCDLLHVSRVSLGAKWR